MSIFQKLFAKKDSEKYKTGKKIREIRNTKHISAKELGASCGVNETAIRNYEQGIRQVNQEKLELIAKRLGVTPSALYDRHIETYVDVMQILFEMSDEYEIVPFSIPQEPKYALLTKDTVLVCAIQAWYEERRRWERKEITLAQLKAWEQAFPLVEENGVHTHGEDESTESIYTDFERILFLKRALEEQILTVNNYGELIDECISRNDMEGVRRNKDILCSTVNTIFEKEVKKYG